MSAELTAGRYDAAMRRRAIRKQREKGCSVYIPAEVLIAAGIDPDGPVPWYRTWPAPGRPRVIVNLYREP